MSSPRPTLTIASVGVSPIPITTTIVSDEPPTYRTNGGDLLTGDRWFDNSSKLERIFINGEWTNINTIADVTPFSAST